MAAFCSLKKVRGMFAESTNLVENGIDVDPFLKKQGNSRDVVEQDGYAEGSPNLLLLLKRMW